VNTAIFFYGVFTKKLTKKSFREKNVTPSLHPVALII